MKLSELAEKTSAVIEQGSANLEIGGAAGLDIAEAGEITFLANPKYTPQIQTTKAGAIFLNENKKIERADIAVLRAKNSYLAYTKALRLFNPEPEINVSMHPRAVIHPTAQVAAEVEIHANVVVGANCVIKSGVRIFPNVTIYDRARIGKNSVIHSGVSIRKNCEIGANCIIHNNTTIGSDGFG
ncbi:MAG: LpxD N-terminal domain-containing protein, partial [Pyrinomonadaceae bacterium]